MSFDRLRSYDAGHFHDVDLPVWYHEANRLCEEERIDFHRAFERYITTLIAASAQSAMAKLQGKIANALISYARHGEGSHVDRDTGLSRIDLYNDRDRRIAADFRRAMAQTGKAGAT